MPPRKELDAPRWVKEGEDDPYDQVEAYFGFTQPSESRGVEGSWLPLSPELKGDSPPSPESAGTGSSIRRGRGRRERSGRDMQDASRVTGRGWRAWKEARRKRIVHYVYSQGRAVGRVWGRRQQGEGPGRGVAEEEQRFSFVPELVMYIGSAGSA